MQAVFDVVDLLQLQEIWVRRPIAQAYSRLERRQSILSCPFDFSVKALMPRLGQLRNSSAWQLNALEKRPDPAQVPMCAFTDAYLEVLFPDDVPSDARRKLFLSVYNHFVVSQYRGDLKQTCALIKKLAEIRTVEPERCLDESDQPLVGSDYWIPVDLTDEIRALDDRYQSFKPDLPATYVVSDDFWPLLVKATNEEINRVVEAYCEDSTCADDCTMRLKKLVDVARDWNRSSSVVGLYYQLES